jgi:hypothetical protein
VIEALVEDDTDVAFEHDSQPLHEAELFVVDVIVVVYDTPSLQVVVDHAELVTLLTGLKFVQTFHIVPPSTVWGYLASYDHIHPRIDAVVSARCYLALIR